MTKKTKKQIVNEMVKHEVKKIKLQEMARTQEWFPETFHIFKSRKHGGKKHKVEGMYNNKRYPGIAYAVDPENEKRYIVFHIKSSKPLFYNVNNEAQARKLARIIVQGVSGKKMSWDQPEDVIMSKENLPIYANIIKRAKRQASKRKPGKFD
jgi:hypothetical protein